jgi:hypothetical protein
MATAPNAVRRAHAPRRIAGLITVGLLLALGLAGCGYPPISTSAFELAKALDNLCNLKATEQLPRARRMIDERTTAGELSAQEAKWLLDIVATAERGDWETATSRARRLLVDQQRE